MLEHKLPAYKLNLKPPSKLFCSLPVSQGPTKFYISKIQG